MHAANGLRRGGHVERHAVGWRRENGRLPVRDAAAPRPQDEHHHDEDQVKAEVVASSNDQDLETHVRLSRFMIERCRRMVESGKARASARLCAPFNCRF